MRLDVNVKAGKSESKVIKKDFGKYEVWVKSQPVKGAANRELINTLADYFSRKPYDLRLVKGLTSPVKVIEISER